MHSVYTVYLVFTKKWLEQHDMHALSSDKDGVFTLATGSVAKGLITGKLGSEAYAKILPADVEACSAAAVSAVRECAETLRLAGLKWVSNEMLLPVEVKNPCCVYQARATIKTHKCPVSARVIHSSCGHVSRAVAAWAEQIMSSQCKKIPWLVKSTKELLDALSCVQCNDGAVLLKLDLKEFYLSGDHDLLINTAADQFAEPTAVLLSSALGAVLHHQTVHFDGSHWKVTKGSGMGAICSGSLSDLVFASLVEIPLLKTRPFAGLLAYVRYRDDTFVALRCRSLITPLITAMTGLCKGVYTITVDEISDSGVSMLDVFVSLKAGQLTWRPYTKPSNRIVPLHSSSIHPWSVHKGWPLMEVRRVFSRSCDRSTFIQFARAKLNNWRRHFMDVDILRRATEMTRDLTVGCIIPPRTSNAAEPETFWLPMRFHPLLRGPLVHEVARLNHDWEHLLRAITRGRGAVVKLAWRSAGKCLLHNLRRDI